MLKWWRLMPNITAMFGIIFDIVCWASLAVSGHQTYSAAISIDFGLLLTMFNMLPMSLRVLFINAVP